MSKIIINAGCICEVNNGLWFVHYSESMLLFFDFQKNEIARIEVFPETNGKESGQYLEIIPVGKMLYLIPYNSDKLWKFNTEEGTFKKIYTFAYGNAFFRGAYLVGDIIYAIKGDYKEVCKINVKDDSVNIVNSFFNDKNLGKGEFYINSTSLYNNEKIVCAAPRMNAFLVFDLKSEEWAAIRSKDKTNYTYIKTNNNNIYAFDANSKAIQLITIEGVIKKKFFIGFDSVKIASITGDVVAVNDVNTGEIVLLNNELDELSRYQTNYILSVMNSQYKHSCWCTGVDKTYAITRGNELLIVEMDLKIETIKLKVENKLWQKCSNLLITRQKELGYENEMRTLSLFLRRLGGTK